MTVIIRKIEGSENEYLAYTKARGGQATYFLYFAEGIWGAVVLSNFVQMLKDFFELEKIEITVHENAVSVKNAEILKFLQEFSKDSKEQ